MRTQYDVEVKITDEKGKRIKTENCASTFRFKEELTDTEPYSDRTAQYFEKYCKRVTEQFQQIIKDTLRVHDVSVRFKSIETWPLLHSYYPQENRFITHT